MKRRDATPSDLFSLTKKKQEKEKRNQSQFGTLAALTHKTMVK
jgi:hypothetical protein